jgi:bifunctional DNase/RNase
LTPRGTLLTIGRAPPGRLAEGDRVIQVRVANLAMDPNTDSPVVLLEGVETPGVLPIWIGRPEAGAIAMQLAGQTFERPLTHDLLRIVIEGLEARVSKIVVTDMRGSTFFAKIFLARGDEIVTIDARPSDSIALALRAQAPIFVETTLFETHSRQIDTDPGPDDRDDDAPSDDPVQRLLDEIDPEDPES